MPLSTWLKMRKLLPSTIADLSAELSFRYARKKFGFDGDSIFWTETRTETRLFFWTETRLPASNVLKLKIVVDGVVCSRNNDRWPRRLAVCECVMPLIYAADGI
jgi:hypothetical protein